MASSCDCWKMRALASAYFRSRSDIEFPLLLLLVVPEPLLLLVDPLEEFLEALELLLKLLLDRFMIFILRVLEDLDVGPPVGLGKIPAGAVDRFGFCFCFLAAVVVLFFREV